MGMFFWRFCAIPGVIFGVQGTPQIDKIRVRLRKAPGLQFWSQFYVLLKVICRVSESFLEDLHGEASSVRIATWPFAQASNVVEEPDGYVNKLVTTALRK